MRSLFHYISWTNFWYLSTTGGALLTYSAFISKGLGVLRDRLLTEHLTPELVDAVFMSFRIPDFFFALLISGTVASIMLPRLSGLTTQEEQCFASSFLWIILLGFGTLCALLILLTPQLTPLVAPGFSDNLISTMTPLMRCIIGSVFLLSISSVLGAYVQHHHHFVSLALAPLLYMGTICLSIFLLAETKGVMAIGYGALLGAMLHMLSNLVAYYNYNGVLQFSWLDPKQAWHGAFSDATRRIINGSLFQINYTIDIIIAGLLITGSVTAATIGINTGHFLLSILGYSAGRYAFPKLTKAQYDYKTQWHIVKQSSVLLLLLSIPPSIIAFLLAPKLISLVFNSLSGTTLTNTIYIFQIVLISLPFACLIPLLSRWFLANNNTKTPLFISLISLTTGTIITLISCFLVFPTYYAVVGIGIGTACTNILMCILLATLLHKNYMKSV